MATDDDEKLQTIPITTFGDAKTAGNTLLYLPRELRDKIYEIVIADSRVKVFGIPNWAHYIDAKDIIMTNTKWLPPICHVSDQIFIEALPVFLQHSVISVGPAYTAWNLHYFLQATGEFGSVRALDFQNPDVLKTGVEAAQLIKNCTDLRKILVDMTLVDIDCDFRSALWTDNTTLRKKFASKFIADQIFQLKNIKKIVFPNLIEFHGLDDWFKEEFEKRGVDVKIVINDY